jgi:hypothetical protein
LISGAGLSVATDAQAADPTPTALDCTTAAVQQAVSTGGAYAFDCTTAVYVALDNESVGQPFQVPAGVQVSLASPPSSSSVHISGRASQIFDVAAGATLRLENVTLISGLSGEDGRGDSSYGVADRSSNGTDGVNAGTNGQAGTGASGGPGDSGTDGHHGLSGEGGAIFNDGTLVLDKVEFSQNTAEGGAGGNGGNAKAGGVGGSGGLGGSGGNGGAGGNPGGQAGDAAGGAIYNAAGATLWGVDLGFIENEAIGGRGGSGGNGANGGSGGAGGAHSPCPYDGGDGGDGGTGPSGTDGGSAAGGDIYNAGSAYLGGTNHFQLEGVLGGSGGAGGNSGSGGSDGGSGNLTVSPTCTTWSPGSDGGSHPGGDGRPGGSAYGVSIFNAQTGTLTVSGTPTWAYSGSTYLQAGNGGNGGDNPNIDGGTGGNGGTGANADGMTISNASTTAISLSTSAQCEYAGTTTCTGSPYPCTTSSGGTGGYGGATGITGSTGATGLSCYDYIDGPSSSIAPTATQASPWPDSWFTGGGGTSPVVTAGQPSVTPTTANVGQTLTANTGTWTASAPISYSYAWEADNAVIPGQTASTLTLAPAQLGAKISVVVTGSITGASQSASSAQTSAIGPGALTAPAAVAVTGSVKVGGTLTAHPGTWGPGGVALTYQWRSAGAVIAGATKPTLKLAAAQYNKAITVTVTGTEAGYASTSRTSGATAKAGKGTLTAVTPKISGKAQVGKKLKASHGTWKPDGVKFSYQWYAGSKKIAGATKSSLTLKHAQAGKKVTVKVTGTLPAYTTTHKTSKATAKIKS